MVPGDRTELICEQCGALQLATWDYDSYVLDDGTKVDRVMVAKCDVCGYQAGLAQQSADRIREARRTANQLRSYPPQP